MRPIAARSIYISCLIMVSATLLGSFHAQAAESKENSFAGFTKYVRYHSSYDVNADGTHVETHEWALKVLVEQGLARANTASISYSDRLQRAEILAAYTLKPDGRRIDVPAANFQEETNTGKGQASPMFSDIRTKTVAFADVAVGDTVVMSYKLVQKEATFPGNFSITHTFSKFVVYDDATIELSAPRSLRLRVYQRGVQGGEIATRDGRRRWSWSYRNQAVAKPEYGSVDPLDYGPLIVVSTFKDYGALAAAYNARAKDKAAVTDKIRKLADGLTANLHTPREQAKALYDWVATNIQYAGNCVGAGSVVPHEASLVLSNRMGDCKDHATLLESLLAAKGIASTQVLLNAGAAYTLPDVPDIGVLDHAINYIPTLDLYVDSTSRYTPFGTLPFGDSDKPVIHTTDFTEIRHTPPTSYKDTGALVTTLLTVHPDGSADGETSYELQGFFGDGARARMSYLEPGMGEVIISKALEQNGYAGTGSLSGIGANPSAGPFTYSSKYRFTDAINVPGPGALPIRSPISGGGNATRFLAAAGEQERTVNFQCYGASWKERYTIHLPVGMEVLAVPRNVEIKSQELTYRASYQLQGSTVEAEREIDERTPGNVCTPAEAARIKSFVPTILRDFRAQLVYR